MASVNVYKNRTNKITVNLGFDVSGDTFVSEIREDKISTSPLIVSWDVTFVNTGVDGKLLLTLDNSAVANITQKKGWMDIKRITAGEPVPVFSEAVQVVFKDTVTA